MKKNKEKKKRFSPSAHKDNLHTLSFITQLNRDSIQQPRKKNANLNLISVEVWSLGLFTTCSSYIRSLRIRSIQPKFHFLYFIFTIFYRSKMWEELFISALDKTSFEGVTGPVRFKGNSRRGNIVIKQIVRKCTPLKTIRIHNATMFQINLFLSRKILV